MKPEKIILVRHGESIGNVNGEVYKTKQDYTVELSPSGVNQALDAGKKLREITTHNTCYFYVSPFYRSRETYQNIIKSYEGVKYFYREDPRLREQEWGHYRGREESDVLYRERLKYGVFYYRWPDGESCADVYDRVSGFFDTLHRDFTKTDFPSNAIIVTHGMTLRVFLMRWFHWTVEEFHRLRNPKNCAIVVLKRQPDGKYKLETELSRRP